MVTLYTHTDFDGIACAALITSVEPVTEIRFEEPGDMQRGEVRVQQGSIISDLPFHPKAGKWFDHHEVKKEPAKFEGSFRPEVASCARVVYEYYDNPFLKRKFSKMVDAADKIDTADYSKKDIERPAGFNLLSLTLDLEESASQGRAYKLLLIELLKTLPLEKILEHPKVKPRAKLALEKQERVKKYLPKVTSVQGKVAIVDWRKAPESEKKGNGRFIVYLQHPECVASIRLKLSKAGNVDIGLGQNIFSRKLKTNLAGLARQFGGGGHEKAAGCKVKEQDANRALALMVEKINSENK